MPKRAVKKDKPAIPKFYRDVITYRQNPSVSWPGLESPVCQKCGLFKCGAKNPFMPAVGAEQPLVTFVLEAPSRKEDAAGTMGIEGQGAFMKKMALDVGKHLNLTAEQFRFAPITRCAVVEGKGNPATGGKWCRHYLYEELKAHPPRMIIPVGSAVLGLLNQKSNAQDWGGRLLTYRGWPDDWLTDRKFENGHFLYGPHPTSADYLPLFPLQKPTLIYGTRNPKAISRWRSHLKKALELAVSGISAPVYDRPWWKLTDNPTEVEEACDWLISHPGTILTFDTETTGLRPFLGEKIVFMMFRWQDETGPRALGWPWDYRRSFKPEDSSPEWKFAESPMLPYLERLAPKILKAVAASKARGHNLTFDLMFLIGSVPGGVQMLNELCDAWYQDTWHMRYALRQEKGSIGLDLVAYDWVPTLAGYEEEFTLLIDRYPELLHPEQGGHYANCPRKYWTSTFRPYVMGDVEVCHEMAESVGKALHATTPYRIPLAHPTDRGRFRLYTTPNRSFVYDNILTPAAAVLTKLMARGMFVDQAELAKQEQLFPKMIFEAKQKLRDSDQNLIRWCQINEAADPNWEFDLGKPAVLKEALFKVMKLPVVSLTDAGDRAFRNTPIEKIPFEDRVHFASTDKHSLNYMAQKFPQVRPLLGYRSLCKQYSSYVRPLRNITTPGIDKKPREGYQMLMNDSCLHTSFKLTGTRSGRLSSSEPNLQQIPRDGMIKKMFTSRFGKRGCIYQADLSQIELRLLAMFCGDPKMVNAYLNDVDLHSQTTSLVFNIPYENFSDDYEMFLQQNGKADEAKKLKGKRKIGKTLNFLTGYGGGALGFQSALALQGIYISLEEAQQHVNNFFDTYPFLKLHIGRYKQFIIDNGRAVSVMGRVRIFEDVYSDDPKIVSKACRSGFNHLVQSSASDIMMLCLAAIEHLMRAEGLESLLMTTVHDSLGIDAIRDEVPKIHSIVEPVLSNIPEVLQMMLGSTYDTSWCICPMEGDSSLGLTYADEIKIPKGNNIDWDRVFTTAFSK
jgi:uracil-DNA glycosylase family 4